MSRFGNRLKGTTPVSQWLVAGGGRVRSLQRGTIVLAGGAGSNTATITAVDTANSRLRLLGTSYDTAAATQTNTWARIALTNATTITATRTGTTGGLTVSYEILEYYAGAMKSVQRGTVVVGTPATITSVETTRTELDWLGQTTNFDGDGRSQARIALTNATTVTATATGGDGGTTTVSYQAVEWL